MIDLESLFDGSFEKEIKNRGDINEKIDEYRNLVLDSFSDIEFVEEGHKYTIEGREYIPVSNIIKKYEPEVDWDQKAADYARKYGRKKEDVQKEWKINNLKSTISGTRTHEFGESYTNLMCGHPELICDQNRSQYVKEYGILIPTYPKEDAVKKFYDDLESNLHPIGAEFKLSSRYMEGTLPICGTCDLLFYDSERDGVVVMDWKTNKSLIKDYSRKYGVMMTGCVSNMVDEPLSHYVLQFNMYQKMLESIGIDVIDRILVWLKDDGTYERINIDEISGDVMDRIMKGEE